MASIFTSGKNKIFTEKIGKYLSFIFLTALSLFSWYFYYHQGLILSYNDARSHLNVARRVFDYLQPGLVQLGTVWLPLYHILELPLIWNDYLWQTGLAGSVISMVAYVFGGIFLLKLCNKLSFDKLAKIFAFLVYSLNPNLLYMQAIPMTESLAIFLLITSTYYLLKWSKNYDYKDLITSAVLICLSTLTRYDGWFLLTYVTLIIIVILKKQRNYFTIEGTLIFFLTLAGFGAFLWFLWNLLIFGDPLYFLLGPYSAKAQQDLIYANKGLFTKGNLPYSIYVYFLTTLSNLGTIVTLLTIVGFLLFFIYKKVDWNLRLTATILFAPFFFNVISLFVGHSAIYLPNLPPYTWFNDRYGLMMLPSAAVFAGYLAFKNKIAFVVLTLSLLIQNAHMYLKNDIITIQDGVRGASGQFLDSAALWIKGNAHEGLILAAAASNDSLLFVSGLPLKRYITEGAQKYWEESMIDPTVHAQWIVMHKEDSVDRKMRTNESFLNNYELVYKDTFSYVYKLNKNRGTRLSDFDLP